MITRAPHSINADLHCHSTVSDGVLPPQDVARRAAQAGVELWALTDHDELGGQEQAREAALACGMHWLSGVEISVSFLSATVHIVGLGFDIHDQTLIEGLAKTRGGREARAQEMAAGLAAVGLKNTFEGAMRFVGNPRLISRSHFARHLVDTGVCPDMSSVFQKYLTPGKPGYVEHRWAKLSDALNWIHGAGGIAVLAHPARYDLTPNEQYALLSEFTGHGGKAVEVVTGSHTAADALVWGREALHWKLMASRGSDFHSPDESHTPLGGLPPLPSSLQPVWTALTDRMVAPHGTVL